MPLDGELQVLVCHVGSIASLQAILGRIGTESAKHDPDPPQQRHTENCESGTYQRCGGDFSGVDGRKKYVVGDPSNDVRRNNSHRREEDGSGTADRELPGRPTELSDDKGATAAQKSGVELRRSGRRGHQHRLRQRDQQLAIRLTRRIPVNAGYQKRCAPLTGNQVVDSCQCGVSKTVRAIDRNPSYSWWFFPTTTIPSSETVNRWRSASRSTPI